MITIYVSGPITGYDIAERKALFGVTTDRLVTLGYGAVNPLEVVPTCKAGSGACGPDSGHSWECWMRHDLIEMLRCDEVAALSGWQQSRGATVEIQLAAAVGIPVHPIEHYLGLEVVR